MPRCDQCKWLRNQWIDELRLDSRSNCRPHIGSVPFCPHLGTFSGAASVSRRGRVRSGRRIHPSDCQVTFTALDIAQRNAALVALRTEPCHCYRDAQLRLNRIKSVTVSVPSFSVDFTTATLTSVSRKARRLKLSLLSGAHHCDLGPCSAY